MIKLNRDPSDLTIQELVDQGYIARVVARHYNPSEHGKAYAWAEKNCYIQSYPADVDYIAEQVVLSNWDKNIGELMKISMRESGGKVDPNKMLLAIMQFVTDEVKRRQIARDLKERMFPKQPLYTSND